MDQDENGKDYCQGFSVDRAAVQSHIFILQGIINRMAGNNASCKTWAIAIVAAVMAIPTGQNSALTKPVLIILPVVFFFILDCFYLGIERHFIKEQELFVSKLNNSDVDSLLFRINKLSGFSSQLCATLKAMRSFSTTPFYGMIALSAFIILV